MRMLGTKESFVSRWSANSVGWIFVFFPTVGVVAMFEGSTPFSHPGIVVLSAVAQHVISGVLAIVVLSIVRRAFGRVPLAVVIATWVLIGVLRGIIGGIFAEQFADIPPQFLERIITWVAMSLIWMPLLAYFFAQLESRRLMFNEYAAIADQYASERARAKLDSQQLSNKVIAAVRDAVAPLVEEVRTSLSAAAERDSRLPLDPISERLEAITETTEAVIAASVEDHHEKPLEPPPSRWAAYREALSFDLTRPVYATALISLTLVVLYLPDAYRAGGLQNMVNELIALLGGIIVMFILMLVLKRIHARWNVSAMSAIAVFIVSGITSMLLMFGLTPFSIELRELYVAMSLPGIFASIGVMYSAAVGVGLTNQTLSSSIDSLTRDVNDLREQSRDRDAQVVNQVHQIMHGPILGRLSACVMALNFYLAEPNPTFGARRMATMDGVLAHLEKISEDFEELELPRQ